MVTSVRHKTLKIIMNHTHMLFSCPSFVEKQNLRQRNKSWRKSILQRTGTNGWNIIYDIIKLKYHILLKVGVKHVQISLALWHCHTEYKSSNEYTNLKLHFHQLSIQLAFDSVYTFLIFVWFGTRWISYYFYYRATTAIKVTWQNYMQMNKI